MAFPADTPCPVCAGLVRDCHAEWTDPALGPDFSRDKGRLIVRFVERGLCTRIVKFKLFRRGEPSADQTAASLGGRMGKVTV
jgi:hypothetical protein